MRQIKLCDEDLALLRAPACRKVLPYTQFLEALEADFDRFGREAITLMRERKPDIYIRVVAGLLPKEANINVEANEAFVELWNA